MRRILFLDHPEPTFGSCFLWHGLKELEEKSNGSIQMTLYPYIPTNFGADQYDLRNLPWYWWLADLVRKSKYGGEPLSYGIPQFSVNEDLTCESRIHITFNTPRLKFPETNLIYDEDHVISEMAQRPFDLIVLGNSHRVPTILLSRLKERVRKLPPVVYLDAGERDELNEHWVHVFKPAVIFKEHLTPEVEAKGLSMKIPNYKFKIYPLPLSQPIANYPSQADLGGPFVKEFQELSSKTKERQVFYWLGATWPLRKKAMDVLDQLMVRKNQPAHSELLEFPFYHRALALSRMGVTMRGSGRDTLRYWEIPLYRTVMIADGTMGCIHPHPFEHEKNALFYNSLFDLEQMVERNMTDYPLLGDLEPIARAGQEHLKRYHSSLARAIFFLERIDENIHILDSDILNTIRKAKVQLGWDDQLPWRGQVTSCQDA
jgi:hypothetical protein